MCQLTLNHSSGSDCPYGVYDQSFVTKWVTAAATHHPWAQGRDVCLLGHSYGGAVCAVAATELTGQLQARVKRVVLLAPAGVLQRPLYTRFIHLVQLLPHPLCDLLVVAAQVLPDVLINCFFTRVRNERLEGGLCDTTSRRWWHA